MEWRCCDIGLMKTYNQFFISFYSIIMRQVQPPDLVHGKRYDIHCFEVVDDVVGSNVVVKMTGRFVTRYIDGDVNDTLVDTHGGYHYIFESLRVTHQMGNMDEIRGFFTNRMGQNPTYMFRVPGIDPLMGMAGLMENNPRHDNVMICTDEHIYHSVDDQLNLNTNAVHRPIRFYQESHTASSGRRGGNGTRRRQRRR